MYEVDLDVSVVSVTSS